MANQTPLECYLPECYSCRADDQPFWACIHGRTVVNKTNDGVDDEYKLELYCNSCAKQLIQTFLDCSVVHNELPVKCNCCSFVTAADCVNLGMNFEKQMILQKIAKEYLKEEEEMSKEISRLGLDSDQEKRWRNKHYLEKLAAVNNGEGSYLVRPCPNPSCHRMIPKRDGCNTMRCPVCQCEFDWLSGDTKDKDLGYLNLFYHMDTTSKYRAYWKNWPVMSMDWVMTGKNEKTSETQ